MTHRPALPYPPLPNDPTFYRGRGVCVTGGAGFIGSHIVDALVGLGARVSVLDDLSNGRETNLTEARSQPGAQLRLVKAAILDDAALDDAVRDVDVIFHHAALGSVPQSVDQPVKAMQDNAMGTLAVLEAARRAGVRRVVYAASSAYYGNQPGSPKVETMPADALSPYAASKIAGELLLRSHAECFGLSTVSLRYFNIFGVRQRADSPYAAVIPIFIEALRAGRKPLIFGDGRQTRDFTHVANVVWANLLAGSTSRGLHGESVNIGCGQGTSLLGLLEALARRLERPAEAEHRPPRTGDVQHSTASIERAASLLGYRPIIGLEEGLDLTLRDPIG